MAELVYITCTLLSIACAVMLLRGYKQTPSQLLLWSSACFGVMALNNVVLFADVIMFPDIEFGGLFFRNISGAIAGSLLLFGLVWEMSG